MACPDWLNSSEEERTCTRLHVRVLDLVRGAYRPAATLPRSGPTLCELLEEYHLKSPRTGSNLVNSRGL